MYMTCLLETKETTFLAIFCSKNETMTAFIKVIVALCAAGIAVAAVDKEFTMQFQGQCTGANTCIGKGPSQDISIGIDPDDAVAFDVEGKLGSYAKYTSDLVFLGNGTYSERGNITFGTSLHRPHILHFESIGASGYKEYLTKVGEYVYTMTARIVDGEGALQDVTGLMSITGYGQEDDFATWTQYVSAVVNEPL
eukprot:m.49684 g.49684  ORF g.49684 m.49684 type:complete len:195 (+) comp11114_c0_seq1:131-715(+)